MRIQFTKDFEAHETNVSTGEMLSDPSRFEKGDKINIGGHEPRGSMSKLTMFSDCPMSDDYYIVVPNSYFTVLGEDEKEIDLFGAKVEFLKSLEIVD